MSSDYISVEPVYFGCGCGVALWKGDSVTPAGMAVFPCVRHRGNGAWPDWVTEIEAPNPYEIPKIGSKR